MTQLNFGDAEESQQNVSLGYMLVVANAFASGAGGVFSEKLLKYRSKSKDGVPVSIHWQNMQLYAFGFAFGLVSLCVSQSGPRVTLGSAFLGFNVFSYLAVLSLTICGLLVSFILKHLDNIAKCFVAALSMLSVALIDALLKHSSLQLQLVLGIILTVIALEQYAGRTA